MAFVAKYGNRRPPNFNLRTFEKRVQSAQRMLKEAKYDLWLYKKNPGALMQKMSSRPQNSRLRTLLAQIR